MDKRFYFLAGVLSVVLVVSLFSLVSALWPFGDKPQLAPPTGNSNIINAHQCSADNICEVSQLTGVPSGGNSSDPTPVMVLTRLIVNDGILTGNTYLDPLGGIFSNWGAIQIYNANISNSGLLLRSEYNQPIYFRTPSQGGGEDVTIAANGDVTIAKLAGNTTSAYVCVDATGKLFRRPVPCV